MQTECSVDLFGIARVERRAVVAAFDGGMVASDAGALRLGSTDRPIRLVVSKVRPQTSGLSGRRRYQAGSE